jgi:hypothetical protein
MFESPQYIAKEYLLNSKIYKGNFPIAIIEQACPLGGYIPPSTYDTMSTPITNLREELDEDDLILIELETPVKVTNADKTVTEIKYVNTENSSNQKLNQKGIHATI